MNTAAARLFASAALLTAAAHAQPTFYGPTPYLCSADSPFAGLPFGYFYLETFEDHLFNVPGVSANQGGVASVVFGPSIHDSVDCDDGVVDGSGLNGDSFFSGAPSMRFTFDAAVLGSLPTHAGIVWTDGGGGAVVVFEAFDAAGASLGTISGSHADDSVNGTTDEDRFYGVWNPGGISAINISHNSGGMEVDHLQYGGGPAPCAADIGIQGGLLGHDGLLDNNDFIAFINLFFNANPGADFGSQGGVTGPDGAFDNNDFIAFINAFFAGCA